MSDTTYANDDWWTCFFYWKSWNYLFLYADQGQVWSWLAMKVVTDTIPSLFHFYPQHNIILQVIKGLNAAIAIYVISLYFNLSKKEIPKFYVIFINTLLILLPTFFHARSIFLFVNLHYKYLFILIK